METTGFINMLLAVGAGIHFNACSFEKGSTMSKDKIRVYSLEVIANGYSFYQESLIESPDDQPALVVARICCKIIAAWGAAEFEDRREIVIRFISSKHSL